MEFLDVPLFDDDIFKLLVRFAINLVFLSLVVRLAIYPNQREREFAFTAVMLNVIVFFICFTMKKLELDLGLALGLFAIFGVLRYRTDALRPKEMTYLFIVIGIAVINSLSNRKTSYAEIALINSVIFAATMLKEWVVGRVPLPNGTRDQAAGDSGKDNAKDKLKDSAKEGGKSNGGKKRQKYTVEYDRLELLGGEHKSAVLNDLKARTGIDIDQFEIRSIDLLQSKATLTIWPSAEPTAEE